MTGKRHGNKRNKIRFFFEIGLTLSVPYIDDDDED